MRNYGVNDVFYQHSKKIVISALKKERQGALNFLTN